MKSTPDTSVFAFLFALVLFSIGLSIHSVLHTAPPQQPDPAASAWHTSSSAPGGLMGPASSPVVVLVDRPHA